MGRPSWRVALGASFSVALACGGSSTRDGDGASDGAGPSRASVIEQLAQASCSSATQACCAEAGFEFSREACLKDRRALMAVQGFLDRVNARKYRYDAAATEACAAYFKAVDELCIIDGTAGPLPDGSEACLRIRLGAQQQGEECGGAEDCLQLPDAPLYCDDHTCVPGTAPSALVPLGEGDLCSGGCSQSDIACTSGSTVCDEASGLYCDFDTHQCVASQLAGMPCARDTQCSTGLLCYEGVCTAEREQGPCGSSPDICATATRCDPMTNECTAYAQVGEPCQDPWCVGSCTNGVCEHRYAVYTGQCSGL
ncbi:MAG TPA: Dickkopf N-terminal cysteine-rich domain-containing protein [Polyangiaceae bacterium]|nr:Dickkopf N-terminal cysteine-rich domain-containing protein [Polyangiaceae bacterium]